jgi:hypothetical protein
MGDKNTTSAYQYISVADLENYTGHDFSALKNGYSDTVIEAWISLAERMINGLINTSYMGTIPDAIKSATLLLTSRIARNRLMDDGFLEEDYKEKKVKEPLIDEDIMRILGYPIASNIFVARGKLGDDAL